MASLIKKTLRSILNKFPNEIVESLRHVNKKVKIVNVRIREVLPFWGVLEGYHRVVNQTPVFDSISFLPINKEWESKWKASKGKRVLFYADKDYSGSLYKWAEAINKYSNYAARLVTSQVHPYGYSTDIVAADCISKSVRKREPRLSKMQDLVLELVSEASIVHYKEERKLFLEIGKYTSNTLTKAIYETAIHEAIPQVYTVYGGYARKYKANEDYIKFVSDFDARVAMTPDLNYEWYSGVYIPHTIDTERYPYKWKDGFCVSHSPSTDVRKGTKEFIQATGRINRTENPLNIDIISGVSHQECMKRKGNATLFFDQAGRDRNHEWEMDEIIGWYGNSAIEAMAFGIPTIAHLSEEALSRAERAGVYVRNICPVLNVGCEDELSLYRAIETFFSLKPNERVALSRKTRKWAEDFHGYQAVSRRLEELYDQILCKKTTNTI